MWSSQNGWNAQGGWSAAVIAVVVTARAFYAGDIAPGLYPEQLYGRDLALLSPQIPESFEMQ